MIDLIVDGIMSRLYQQTFQALVWVGERLDFVLSGVHWYESYPSRGQPCDKNSYRVAKRHCQAL